METIGIWIAALLTICIFSFLFRDNPFYRFAEHLLVGVSAGYFFARYSWDVLEPKLFTPLFTGENLWLLLLLIMGLMMFGKLTKDFKWTARWPIAFVVGCTVGLQVNSYLQADVVAQCKASMRPFQGKPAIVYEVMKDYVVLEKKREFKEGDAIPLEEVREFNENWMKSQIPDDRNGDGKLEEKEWKKFAGITQTQFRKIDKNRDFAISQEELKNFRLRYPAQYRALGPWRNLTWQEKTWNSKSLTWTQCAPYPATGRKIAPVSLSIYIAGKIDEKKSKEEKEKFAKECRDNAKSLAAARGHMKAILSLDTFLQNADRNQDKKLSSLEWHAPPYWFKGKTFKESLGNFLTSGFFMGLVALIGIISALIYFFFSTEHHGALKVSSQIGIYFLMVCFGASFGYTVMARISLLIGRMTFLLGDWAHLIK